MNRLFFFEDSNTNGNYELSYSGKESELLLVVSGLGIATQLKKIPNQSQTINFTVQEEEFQLKEVQIKSSKIYYSKDTINYSVAAFTDDKDVVIGDVLKKMPGIDVSESGQISYQGRPINKFYIENMDMLNGIDALYNGYLLQTYSYLSLYNSRLADFSGTSLSAKIDYKDIIRMFFSGVGMIYFHNKNSVTYTQQFEDYLSVSSFIPQSNSGNSVLATGRISKGFDWKISDEIQTVFSYTCQKATISFRGRDFIAWFAADIPVPNGPWKFGGLPGLILKLYDSENNFVYECQGLEQLKNKEAIKYYKLEYTKISRKELDNLYRKFHDDYAAYNTSLGTPVYERDPKTKQMLKVEHSFGKIPYNPIELE